jgi:hypothetical protein
MIGVIRQPIGIPDDILPDAWRNNNNNSTTDKGQTCTSEDQITCLEEEIEKRKNLQYNTVHDDDDDDDPCAVPDDFIELPVVKTSSSSISTHGRVYRGA